MIIGLLMSLAMVAFVLPTFILSCNNAKIAESDNSVVLKAAIPPIDVSMPTKTETATFALG